MHYEHVPQQDHRDLASGTVLHSRPGQPAFPIRLARELFARARHHWQSSGRTTGPSSDRVTLWDPCCGSAQLLVSLGLTERRHLNRMVGSDINGEALSLAANNATLLTTAGLMARHRELDAAAHKHGKPSHARAAQAAVRLARTLERDGGDLPIDLHRADALNLAQVEQVATRARPDIVIADLPHSHLTYWTSSTGEADPTAAFAHTVARTLPNDAIIVLVARSRRPPLPAGTRALDRLRIGHRSVAITRASWLVD